MTLTEPMKASPDTCWSTGKRLSLSTRVTTPVEGGGAWEGHLDITRQNLPENKANPNERKSKKQE